VQKLLLEVIGHGLVKSAHDCSEGGLAIAIAESCLVGDIGFKGGSWKMIGRLDSIFFGELQSRVVVSVAPGSVAKLDRIATKWHVPLTLLGTVGGKRLSVGGYIDLPLAETGKAWRDGIKQLLN
jgi:phosphoribosylformylglycinamidine synthase